ncbi:MAG: hypothetical protein V1740_03390 [Candidatus Woesearchaeota archaeon]
MKDVIAAILGGIGEREKQYYLDRFRHEDPSKFAVIKVSGECVRDSLDQIVYDLSQLQKLDLNPIVIFGWGEILNQKLTQAGIIPKFIGGDRVTDLATLALIQETVAEITGNFLSEAAKYDLDLADLTSRHIFDAEQFHPDLGYVGHVTGVDIGSIVAACQNHQIPLVAPLGYQGSQVLNINGDTAGKALVVSIKPDKYIVLTSKGGILDSQGNLLRKMSIVDDYDRLVREGVITDGMLKKVEDAKALLEELRDSYCVEIASPKNLFVELFTYQGSGTKIVLGYNTHIHSSLDGIDQDKAKQLIEASIEKTLAHDYFSSEQLIAIVLEEDYDGIGIVQNHNGWAYMDKFAISRKSQDQGLGTKIFSEILGNLGKISGKPGMFWRSDPQNPNNKWYFNRVLENKGGCQVSGGWVVYWIGIPQEEIPDIIQYASNKEPTMFKKQ